MAAPTYSVTLHHLSPDAKAAGLAFPDTQLPAVTTAQLSEILYALAEVATTLTIYEPSTPEIRIKTERDAFVVRTRNRRLFFVGYETILRGEDHSVTYILSTVTGTTEPGRPAPRPERIVSTRPAGYSRPPMPMGGGVSRTVKIAVMAVIIVGCNATAVWMLLRPPPTLTPKYDLLPETESKALVAKTAGEYRTGSQAGARRLVVVADGNLRVAKFAAQQAVVDETTKTVRGAIAQGRAALVTNDASVLVIKDPDTVVLYGVTYRRFIP